MTFTVAATERGRGMETEVFVGTRVETQRTAVEAARARGARAHATERETTGKSRSGER